MLTSWLSSVENGMMPLNHSPVGATISFLLVVRRRSISTGLVHQRNPLTASSSLNVVIIRCLRSNKSPDAIGSPALSIVSAAGGAVSGPAPEVARASAQQDSVVDPVVEGAADVGRNDPVRRLGPNNARTIGGSLL